MKWKKEEKDEKHTEKLCTKNLHVKDVFSGTILENFFGCNPLCVRASCQCSLGVWEAVSRREGTRCTTLVKPIAKALTKITFRVFLSLIKEISGLLPPFIIIYKEFKCFFHRCVHNCLIWAPTLHAHKIDKTKPKFL